MSGKPKDHCVVVEMVISPEGVKRREYVTYYKNINHPSQLLEVTLAQNPEAINEWAAFKKREIDWMVEETKQERKEKINRTSWRRQLFSWQDLRDGE